MRASAGVDNLLDKTGIPEATGNLVGGVGDIFGPSFGEIGREIGSQAPRDILNLAPAMFGAGLPGIAATALLAGTSAYERSGGSIPAAVVGGITGGVMPKVARFVGQQALKLADSPVGKEGLRRASSIPERLFEVGAENVGATVLGEVGGQVTSLAEGQGLYNPFTPENLFAAVAGNIPFAFLDAAQLVQPLAKRTAPLTGEQVAATKRLVEDSRQMMDAEPASKLHIDEDGQVVYRGADGEVHKTDDITKAETAVQANAEMELAVAEAERQGAPIPEIAVNPDGIAEVSLATKSAANPIDLEPARVLEQAEKPLSLDDLLNPQEPAAAPTVLQKQSKDYYKEAGSRQKTQEAILTDLKEALQKGETVSLFSPTDDPVPVSYINEKGWISLESGRTISPVSYSNADANYIFQFGGEKPPITEREMRKARTEEKFRKSLPQRKRRTPEGEVVPKETDDTPELRLSSIARDLEDARANLDSHEKLLKYLDLLTQSKTIPTEVELAQLRAAQFILPNEQKTMFSANLTPAEAVARFLQSIDNDVVAKAKITQLRQAEILAEQAAAERDRIDALPPEQQAEAERQLAETSPLGKAILALKPEYAARAAAFIRSAAFGKLVTAKDEDLINARIEDLKNQYTDPDIRAALEQERAVQLDPRAPYDAELAGVLDNEEGLGSQLRSISIAAKSPFVADVTEYVYSYVAKQQAAGVPAEKININSKILLEESRKGGYAVDMTMEPMKRGEDGTWTSIERATDYTAEEAAAYAEWLNWNEARPGEKYVVAQNTGDEGSYPVVRKMVSRTMGLVEDFDVRQKESPNAWRQDAEEKAAKMLEDDADTTEIEDFQARVTEEVLPDTKQGVRGGLDYLLETVQARRRALLERFDDVLVAKPYRVDVKERLAILLELETHPRFRAPGQRSKKEGYNYKLIAEAWEFAGLASIPRSDTNFVGKMSRTVEGLLGGFNRYTSMDQIMVRLQKRFSEVDDWVKSPDFRETSLEEYISRREVEEFKKSSKLLQALNNVEVVRNIFDLDKFDKSYRKNAGNKLATAEGFFDPKTQRVFIIAENIIPRRGEVTLGDQARRVLWHEVVGHFGAERVFGAEYNAMMRKLVRDMPEDLRTSIQTRIGASDKADPLIGMEYVALLAEQGDPQAATFAGQLRQLARRLNKPMEYDQKIPFTTETVIGIVERARDHIFKKRGLGHLIGSGHVEAPGMQEEPASMGLNKMSDYLSDRSDSLLYSQAPRAFDIVFSESMKQGLPESEAVRRSNGVMRMLRAKLQETSVRVEQGFLTGDSPLGGKWMLKTPRGVNDIYVKSQEAMFVHEGFAHALDSAAEHSPIRTSQEKLDHYLQAKGAEASESLRSGMKKLTGFEQTENMVLTSREVASMVANALVVKGELGLRELVDYAPAEISNFARALTKDALSLAQGGLSVRQAEELGVTSKRSLGYAQKKALEKIYDLAVPMRELDARSSKIDSYIEKMGLQDPEAFTNFLYGVAGRESVGLKDLQNELRFSTPYRTTLPEAPRKPSWLARQGELFAISAEKYPELRPLLNTAIGYTAVSQRLVSQAFEKLGMEIVKNQMVPSEKYNQFKKVLNTPSMKEGVGVLARAQNEKVDRMSRDKKTLAGMTPGQARLTSTEIEGLRKANPKLRNMSDEDFQITVQATNNLADAMKVMSDGGLMNSQANNIVMALTAKLARAGEFKNLEAVDKLGVILHNHLLGAPLHIPKELAAQMDSQVLNGVLAELNMVYQPKFDEFANYLRKRDGYFPEFRLGKFVMRYKDVASGTMKTIGARDLAEVYRLRKELVAEGKAVDGTIEHVSKESVRDDDMLLGKGSLERAQEIEKAALEDLRKTLGDDAYEKNVLPYYEPLSASIQSEAVKTMQEFMKSRKLAGGREDLDMVDVALSYIPAVAYGSARSYVRKRAGFFMRDSRLQDNPELKAYAEEQIKNVLRPSGKAEQAIRELAFQWFMGMNPSTMAFEGLQSFSTLAPWLTRHGAGFMGSYKELASAMKSLAAVNKNGTFKDPELQAAMERAVEEAVISRGMYQELEDPSGGVAELQDLVSGKVGKGKLLAKSYMNFTRNLYGTTAYYNSRLAFVAGYKRAQKMGMKKDEAFDFARRTVLTTMFTGGKANRAVGLYSGEPGSQPVRAAIGALQTYFQGMVGTMVKGVQDSIDPTLPPAERNRARAATFQVIGTQLFLAGGLGLPGVEAAAALLEQLFPELELRKNMEKIPKEILGDSSLGNMIVDSALYGIPTATTPLDVSGRIGLGQVLGVNTLSGFDPGALFGPVGSVVSGAGKAVQQVQQGELTKAAESMSPIFLRNLIKAAKDEGAVRDYSGNLITHMTGGQRLLQGLGFRPKEIADFQEAQTRAKRSIAVENRREAQFTRELAHHMINGDNETVMKQVQERAVNDPLFDPKAALRKAATKAADMELPMELGRGMGRSRADKVAGALGDTRAAKQPVSELDRMQKRMQFESLLGVPGLGVPTKNSIQMAIEVDNLRRQNPNLTVDQARKMLEESRLSQQGPQFVGMFPPL
jgi:hypothetical protein